MREDKTKDEIDESKYRYTQHRASVTATVAVHSAACSARASDPSEVLVQELPKSSTTSGRLPWVLVGAEESVHLRLVCRATPLFVNVTLLLRQPIGIVMLRVGWAERQIVSVAACATARLSTENETRD